MSQHRWILGYHGCDAKLGEAILRGEEILKPSENDYDWLGSGIYFWENDPKRAWDWAVSMASNPRRGKNKFTNPFAIGAIIDLGLCLDLSESPSIALLKTAHEEFQKQTMVKLVNEGTLEKPGPRKLDCAVVNFLHALRQIGGEEPFDSVRALFPEGGTMYDNAGFLERTHVQIAVRQEASIIGYFRPRFDRL